MKALILFATLMALLIVAPEIIGWAAVAIVVGVPCFIWGFC